MGDLLAVGLVARADSRRRWRGVVATTLLVGAVGAVVLGAAAGARRSDSALARFNQYSRSSNAELTVPSATPAQLRAFRRVPAVDAVAVVQTFALEQGDGALRRVSVGATVDGALGRVVDRARLIA